MFTHPAPAPRAPAIILAVLCAASASAVLATASLPQATTPEEQTKYLIVMVRGKLADGETAGAGVIVGQGADRLYVATANHVVRAAAGANATGLEVMLRWTPGEWHPATVTSDFDPQLDLAVISIPNSSSLLKQVRLPVARLAADVQRKQQVFSIGYAGGIPWFSRVTPDVMSEVASDALRVETGLEVQPGQSGGALVNQNSEIVGIVKHYATPVAVAIPITRAIEWLKQRNYPVFLRTAATTEGSTSGGPPAGGRGVEPGREGKPPATGGGGNPGPSTDPVRTGASEWPMAGANGSRTNFNERETSLSPPFMLGSQIPIPGLHITSLVFARGYLYASGTNSPDGRNVVVAFDGNGNRAWTFTLDSAGRAGAVCAFADGLLIIGASRDATVYAVASDTGKLVWKTAIGGGLIGRNLLVHGQTAYALATNALVGLDARSGRLMSQTSVRTGIPSPVVYGSLILVTERTEAGYMVTTVAPDGSIRRTLPASVAPPIADPVTSPMGSLGQRPVTTMFISSGTELAAQTMGSEAPVWKVSVPGGRASSPHMGMAYGLVFLRLSQANRQEATTAQNEGGLYAFDAVTGKSVWRFGVGGMAPRGPAIANSVVYVTSDQPSKIFAVSIRTGSSLWYSFLPSPPTADPIVANGQLYVALGSSIFVFRPERPR